MESKSNKYGFEFFSRVSVAKATRAVVARLLFAVHSFIAIWRLWSVEGNVIYLTIGLIPCLLFVEGAVTICLRNSDEYKWFCPCVFIFLCGSVPPIWFLEIDQSLQVITRPKIVTPAPQPTTPCPTIPQHPPSTIFIPEVFRTTSKMPLKTTTTMSVITSSSMIPFQSTTSLPAYPVDNGKQILYVLVGKFNAVTYIPVKEVVPLIDPKIWLQGVEQSLLVILVIGRWILPKGEISRDQLSQLLLAYIAISSDIVSLFDIFNEQVVREDLALTVIVLTIWSISLVQYAMVVTTLSAKKVRPALSADGNTKNVVKKKYSEASVAAGNGSCRVEVNVVKENPSGRLRWWERTDVWGIVMTIFLQDGPFFGLRVYLISCLGVMSYTMLFFVAKNSLIISVQMYRLGVLCCEVSSSNKNDTSDADGDRQSYNNAKSFGSPSPNLIRRLSQVSILPSTPPPPTTASAEASSASLITARKRLTVQGKNVEDL